MIEHVIPEKIANFVLEKIDSVAELEALLILRQSAPTKWDAGSLAGRLYITEPQTNELLRALYDKRLALADTEDPPHYSYGPANSELGLTVDGLAEIYSRHLVPVTNLIHSKPKLKFQGFADAFKFRKDH